MSSRWGLVVADAGFVGYGLCRRLLRHGQHFLLRVGGNITLLKGLGYHHEERDGLVYLWPQKHRTCRPLVLRLIVLRHGKQDVYLWTDVLGHERLTDAEAAELFGMRWGEKVFFRSYKQTLQRRRLLSRTAATCLAEVQWTLLGLWLLGPWLLGLMTVSRLVSDGVDPLAMSVAKARDVVRGALRDTRPRRGPRTLDAGSCAARKDTDHRDGDGGPQRPAEEAREAARAAENQDGDGGRSQTAPKVTATGNPVKVDGVGCHGLSLFVRSVAPMRRPGIRPY